MDSSYTRYSAQWSSSVQSLHVKQKDMTRSFQKPSLRSHHGQYEIVPGETPREIYAQDVQNDIEAQNDDLIDELHEKVQGLKQLAFGIRYQVQESNTLLDQMNSAMTTAANLLNQNLVRLRVLSQFKTRSHLCSMMLFFFGVLFIMYLFFGPRR